MSEDEYDFIRFSLTQISERLDRIEANQAKPESGTTGGSAAGGGITPVNSACSAGRVPCLTEMLDYAKDRRKYLSRFYRDRRCKFMKIEAENFIQWIEDRIIEARRRDAGCVEPPAGITAGFEGEQRKGIYERDRFRATKAASIGKSDCGTTAVNRERTA